MENLSGGSLEIFKMTIHCKVSARQVYCMLERGLPSNREVSAWHDNTEGILVLCVIHHAESAIGKNAEHRIQRKSLRSPGKKIYNARKR